MSTVHVACLIYVAICNIQMGVGDEVFIPDSGNNVIYMGTVRPGESLLNISYSILPLPNLTFPAAVNFDPIDRMLYYTEIGRIYRTHLDGTNRSVIVSALTLTISLDLLDRKLYWADNVHQRIERANFDGSNRSVILSSLTSPYAIFVDGVAGYLYFDDFSRITRSKLDGSEKTDILMESDIIQQRRKTDLFLDREGTRLYWCDLRQLIESVNLNGTDRTVVFNGTLSGSTPYTIFLYNGVMYWADFSRHGIGAVNITTGEEIAFTTTLHNPNGDPFQLANPNYGLHVNTIKSVDYCSSTPCVGNSTCLNDVYTYNCVCPIYSTGRNCEIDINECLRSGSDFPCDRVNGICINTIGSYQCSCVYHYQLNEDGVTCDVANEVFVTDFANNVIYMGIARPDDSLLNISYSILPLANLTFPGAIDFDPVDQMIYYTPIGSIYRSNLDGSNRSLVATTLTFSLALDVQARKLYWTDNFNRIIERSNLDGSNRTVILSSLTSPSGIAVDGVAGYLYFTDLLKITRSTLDGTDLTDIVVDTGLNQQQRKNELFLDKEGSRLYWSDQRHLIEFINLDGSDRTLLFNGSSAGSLPFSIYLYSDTLYWGDIARVGIGAVNITTGEEIAFTTTLYDPSGDPLQLRNPSYGLHVNTIASVDYCSSTPCVGNSTCLNEVYTYNCVCPIYSTGRNCEIDVNECDRTGGDYPCDPVGGNCTNTIGSYTCSCRDGWLLTTDPDCEDINECLRSGSDYPCDRDQGICNNTIGSYRCSCIDNYRLNDDGVTCDDINECELTGDDFPCDPIQGNCTNTDGSFTCSCNHGYEIANYPFCTDIDECQLIGSNFPCDQENGICVNTWGSFNCFCRPGYQMNVDGATCEDIDECSLTGVDYPCHPDIGNCTNTIGSYNCSCIEGWMLTTSPLCEDANECLRTGNDFPCDQDNGTCTNTHGSYYCACVDGYQLDQDGVTCIDVDECSDSSGGFSPCDNVYGECSNTIGSYQCSCNEGYMLNADGFSCGDINECARSGNAYPCDSTYGECLNLFGSYRCSCLIGFRLTQDGITCEDVNECELTDDAYPCDRTNGNCSNSVGTYTCRCREGWELISDRYCSEPSRNSPVIAIVVPVVVVIVVIVIVIAVVIALRLRYFGSHKRTSNGIAMSGVYTPNT